MQVWVENRHQGVVLSEPPLRRCVERLLEALQWPEAEISIVLVDDGQIADLNKQYLNRESPTNVIAFPMQEGEGAHVAPHLLGDVVISLDTALREAEAADIPWRERVVALLIHGTLHLLGYDHVEDEMNAKEMEAMEGRLMAAVKDEVSNLRIERTS